MRTALLRKSVQLPAVSRQLKRFCSIRQLIAANTSNGGIVRGLSFATDTVLRKSP